MLDLKQMHRKVFPVKARSDLARELRIPGGGTVTIEYGLHYLQGNAGSHVSVTVDVHNNRGSLVTCGTQPDLRDRFAPELAPLAALHLSDPINGPMHYRENARYWWELETGYSRWMRRAGDPDYRTMFDVTVTFGAVPDFDRIDDHPCTWLPVPDDEGKIGPAEVDRARLRVDAWCVARLDPWRAHAAEVLWSFCIDPTWNPAVK